MQQDKPRKVSESDLDRAIEATFPASDPVAPRHITGAEPAGAAHHPPAPTGRPVHSEAKPSGAPPVPAAPRSDEEVDAAVCSRCKGTGFIGVYACPRCNGREAR